MPLTALEITAATGADADYFMIEATPAFSPAVTRPKGFKFLRLKPNPLVEGDDMITQYLATFGDLGKPNDVIFLRITPISSFGLANTPLIVRLALDA